MRPLRAVDASRLPADQAQQSGRDGQRDLGRFTRVPRHERRAGLLVEDELKTNLATFIQDAFRAVVGALFYIIPALFHDIVVDGRENVSGHHPTLVLSNHKRDVESFFMLGVNYFARGITRPNKMFAAVLREDVFWPGFLAYYLRIPPLFAPFGWLLRWWDCAPHMHFLKAFPMGHLTNRSQLPHIQRQLDRLAQLLDRGRDLYWTPEGGLSTDGRFGRIRAGLYRVIQHSQAPARVLPMATFYDFMTTQRTRCFVRIGPEYDLDRGLSKPEFEQQARVAILRQMTINIGHLAAALLREQPASTHFDQAELPRLLLAQARRYAGAGLAVDPRLRAHRSFSRRLKLFLRYAGREGILRQEAGQWHLGAGLSHPQMQYALSELAEVERALGIAVVRQAR